MVLEQSLTGRPRRRAKAHVRATQPHCHLCGYPIDQSLDRIHHPLSSTIDEIRPRSQGGSALDPMNLGHAHRCCNTSRGTKPITAEVRARCQALVRSHLHPTKHPTINRTW